MILQTFSILTYMIGSSLWVVNVGRVSKWVKSQGTNTAMMKIELFEFGKVFGKSSGN